MKTLVLIFPLSVIALIGSAAEAADGSRVKQKASETAQAVGDYAMEAKDDFKKQMNGDLAEIQSEMESLKKRAQSASGAAQDSMKRQMAELENKRQLLKKKLDDTAQTSGEAWTQMKSGMKKAMEEIKEGFRKAKATVTDEPTSSKN